MSGQRFSLPCDISKGLEIEVHTDSEGDLWIGTNDVNSQMVLLTTASAKDLGKYLLSEVERREGERIAVLEGLLAPATALYTEYAIALKPGARNEEIRDNMAAAIKRANS